MRRTARPPARTTRGTGAGVDRRLRRDVGAAQRPPRRRVYPAHQRRDVSCRTRLGRRMDAGRGDEYALILLSQKVAADGEENHLFGKTHTSAMGGWNGSAEIKRW